MASISIKKLSRIRYATLRLMEGITFFDLPRMPEILQADDDEMHVVVNGDRIDQISVQYYGTPDLWWVIARANSLRLIPRDLKLNSKLTIPSRKRVFTKILALAR